MESANKSLYVLAQKAKSLLTDLKNESLRKSIDERSKDSKINSTEVVDKEESSWDEFSETIGEIIQVVNAKRFSNTNSQLQSLGNSKTDPDFRDFREDSFVDYESWKQKLPEQEIPQKNLDDREEDYFANLNNKYLASNKAKESNKPSTKENQLDDFVLNNSTDELIKDEKVMPYYMQRRDQIRQEIK